MGELENSPGEWIKSALVIGILMFLVLAACGGSASGFYSNGRWSQTATDGPVGPTGTSITVTWGIVPDGTTIPGYGPSGMVSWLDGIYGGAQGVDDAPWLTLIRQSFQRWDDLGGIEFVYESADDGVPLGSTYGELGVRADVRIGGAWIDGSGGTLAQTGFLDHVDITIDTADSNFFSNSKGFRNNLMHEIGHALGLGHKNYNTSAQLMEPIYSSSIDGPQFDDIRGLHYLYGDAYEQLNDGLGNGSISLATPLGTVAHGQSFAIGGDANGLFVFPSESDFVSISKSSDEDFYAIEVEPNSSLTIQLTPVGPNYGEEIGISGLYRTVKAAEIGNLDLAVYGLENSSAVLLAESHDGGNADPEEITSLTLIEAGTYYIRVSGEASTPQTYTLEISSDEILVAGDYNGDAQTDAADYTVWRDAVSSQSLIADGSSVNFGVPDGVVDVYDFDYWAGNYGNSISGGSGLLKPVPEPSSQILTICAYGVSSIFQQAAGNDCSQYIFEMILL